MTHIVLTRHGHVEGIAPPHFRGRRDLPLTALGQEQARRLGALIATRDNIDALYTSPLSRCVDTSAAIAAATGVTARVLTALADIDYGDWTGRSLADVERSDPQRFAQWWSQPQLVRPPNGETLPELVARTADALRDVLARHARGRIVLVGHDSTNRALLLTLLDLPPSAFWRFTQSPCNLTDIEVSPEGVRVHSINETLHLRDLAV